MLKERPSYIEKFEFADVGEQIPGERALRRPVERPLERPVERPLERPLEGPLEGPQERRQEKLRTSEDELDGIFLEIGGFGRFQLLNLYLLLCLPLMFNASQSISHIFAASPIAYSCNQTECGDNGSGFWEPKYNFNITGDYKTCNKYIYNPTMDRRYRLSPTECDKKKFDERVVEECVSGVTYHEADYTAASEFGYLCSDKIVPNLADIVNNIGQLVGLPLGGFVADVFGRRKMLIVAGYVSSFVGIIRSFSTNYFMFLFYELIEMVFGSMFYPTAFLLAIETVGKESRVITGTIITIVYTLGKACLARAAENLANWRVFLRLISIVAAFQMYSLVLMRESVHWHLSRGHLNSVQNIVTKASRANGKILNRDAFSKLRHTYTSDFQMYRGNRYAILRAIKRFPREIICFSVCWFTLTIGLSANYYNLGGNKYENFFYNSFVQIPGLCVSLVVLRLSKRRIALILCLIISAVLVSSAPLFYIIDHKWRSIHFVVAETALTCSIQILYFFVSESFPTTVRSSLLSLIILSGTVLSMLLPSNPSLHEQYHIFMPHIIYFMLSFVCATLLLLIRDTSCDKSLPLIMNHIRNR